MLPGFVVDCAKCLIGFLFGVSVEVVGEPHVSLSDHLLPLNDLFEFALEL